jgi:hypothetical protein
MNLLPNDPGFLALSREELMFLYHWKRKFLDDSKNDFAVMLGARWSLKQLREQAKKRNRKRRKGEPEPEFLDFPLVVLQNPNAMKILKSLLPKQQKINGEDEIESVFGYDPVRRHQRQMLKSAREALRKGTGKDS